MKAHLGWIHPPLLSLLVRQVFPLKHQVPIEPWDTKVNVCRKWRGILPPLRSALAPMYWKLSMLITSMMGQTTRLLSSTTRASRGSNQS